MIPKWLLTKKRQAQIQKELEAEAFKDQRILMTKEEVRALGPYSNYASKEKLEKFKWFNERDKRFRKERDLSISLYDLKSSLRFSNPKTNIETAIAKEIDTMRHHVVHNTSDDPLKNKGIFLDFLLNDCEYLAKKIHPDVEATKATIVYAALTASCVVEPIIYGRLTVGKYTSKPPEIHKNQIDNAIGYFLKTEPKQDLLHSAGLIAERCGDYKRAADIFKQFENTMEYAGCEVLNGNLAKAADHLTKAYSKDSAIRFLREIGPVRHALTLDIKVLEEAANLANKLEQKT